MIAQIRTLESVRPGLLEQLVRMFCQNVDRVLIELDHDIADVAREKLRMSFHSLKGTAASIGAERLSGLAAQVESAAAGNAETDALWEIADAFRAEFLATKSALWAVAGLSAPT